MSGADKMTAADFFAEAQRIGVRPGYLDDEAEYEKATQIAIRDLCSRVQVRGLTGKERRLLTERAKDGNPLQAFEVVGLASCRPTFSEEEALALEDIPGQITEQLAQAILSASGLMPKAQDDAAKN